MPGLSVPTSGMFAGTSAGTFASVGNATYDSALVVTVVTSVGQGVLKHGVLYLVDGRIMRNAS